jgi:long-chain acyl-CoA synthetase
MPIYQGYGLTEASPVVCSNRAPRIQNGQNIEAIVQGVGSPVLNVQYRMDDQDRLWVKGPGVMQGYWRNEQATDEKIKDGWLDTGDCASEVHDNSTTLHIAGRADEVQVLSTGHKFAPCILEQTIAKLDGIADCVVVGTGLRRPLVIVQLKDSYPADDLAVLEQIHRGLGPQPDYLQVAQVVFADEPWTVENGLRHWKGGINRREIIRRLTPK